MFDFESSNTSVSQVELPCAGSSFEELVDIAQKNLDQIHITLDQVKDADLEKKLRANAISLGTVVDFMKSKFKVKDVKAEDGDIQE